MVFLEQVSDAAIFKVQSHIVNHTGDIDHLQLFAAGLFSPVRLGCGSFRSYYIDLLGADISIKSIYGNVRVDQKSAFRKNNVSYI